MYFYIRTNGFLLKREDFSTCWQHLPKDVKLSPSYEISTVDHTSCEVAPQADARPLYQEALQSIENVFPT